MWLIWARSPDSYAPSPNGMVPPPPGGGGVPTAIATTATTITNTIVLHKY